MEEDTHHFFALRLINIDRMSDEQCCVMYTKIEEMERKERKRRWEKKRVENAERVKQGMCSVSY